MPELNVRDIMKSIVVSFERSAEIKTKMVEFALSRREEFIKFCGDEYWEKLLSKYPTEQYPTLAESHKEKE